MRDFAWTASGGSIENIPSRRASTHARRTGLASRWSPGALPDLSVSTSASSTSTASPRTPVNVLSTRKPTDLAKDLPSVLCTPPHITTCTFGDDISPVPRPQEWTHFVYILHLFCSFYPRSHCTIDCTLSATFRFVLTVILDHIAMHFIRLPNMNGVSLWEILSF